MHSHYICIAAVPSPSLPRIQPRTDYDTKAGDNVQRHKDIADAEAGGFVADFFTRRVDALSVPRRRKLIADARCRR